MTVMYVQWQPDLVRADAESLARLDTVVADQAHGDADAYLYFERVDDLFSALSAVRLALLGHLRRHPARSIEALAATLGRERDAVRADVEALTPLGLVVESEGEFRAPHDEVRFALHLLAPASAA